MSDLFATVAGHRATGLTLCVPNSGPWFCDLTLDEAVSLSGRVAIQIGPLALSGTVAPTASGTFVLSAHARVVAGGGGWGQSVAPKGYHNDAGVKARTVADDAARAVGETIASFVPKLERIGVDYVRRACLASRVLEDALGGVPWWVDYKGVTQCAPRPATALKAGAYELLEYDPTTRVAVLAVDDPSAVVIGSTLTDRLEGPRVVRELVLEVQEGKLRVKAWCGGDDTATGRLGRALSTIARRATDAKLFGKYRYRVVTMAPDGRVNLQAVSKADGLPDLLPVSQKPGASGWHAELTPGAVVYVEFVAGNLTDPIVTGFPGKDEPGATPVSLAFGGGSAAIARAGDEVKVLLPPAVFTGVIGGSPASGVLTFPTGYTLGTIQVGRAELKA